MKVLEALQWRYAVKTFSDKRVAESDLQALLDATRLTASAFGLQPYKLIVVKSRAIREQLVPFSFGQDKVVNSSHLLVLAIDTHIDEPFIARYISKHSDITGQSQADLAGLSGHIQSVFNDMTDDKKRDWAHQQGFIAMGNLLTAAALMNIDTCPMTGFDPAGYDQVLGLSEKGLTSSWVCPIGYRHQDDQRATEPKVRYSHQEMVLEI